MNLPRTLLLLFALIGTTAHADVVQVAVAANFSAPMKQLAAQFERATGHQALLSFGATATLYGQIHNGAPFDLLLAADALRPSLLEQEGLGVPGKRFTYATGRLALWSARADVVDAQGEVLRRGDFKRLAVASGALAPYGEAAMQVLDKLGLRERLADRLVTGESIGQAYAFVATGNAELGLVALSQLLENGKLRSGSVWIVPQALHQPLHQDAVLLMRARDKPAAHALFRFLSSSQTQRLIRSYGYDL